ncbi:EAL domain-containing protein [Shewanella gelidimarina]|uniref:EAL domain-containing protein n=1 Tax=Shewanella gelidimarina TaxID=56813 RepID=UPI0020105797|nr:EAL domain-containing protein [Shewanella gelidimarina]MCL1059956.1 EAL domain-containing protein [Shewanella gelidimarina]
MRHLKQLKKQTLSLLQIRKYQWLVSILLFVTPFAILLPAEPAFISYSINSHVNDTLKQITIKINNISQILQDEKLINKLNFDCKTDDLALLSSRDFNPLYVRVIQLELSNGEKCSNFGSAIIKNMSPAIFVAEHNFTLASTVSHLSQRRETILVQSHGEHRLLTVINSRVLNNYLDSECADCYQLKYSVPGLPTMIRGEQELQQKNHRYSASSQYSNKDYSITLRAGDRLYEELEEEIDVYLYISSFIIAILFNIIFWSWCSSRASLKGMIIAALSNNEFIPYYQPVINSKTGKVIGQEVLIRWQLKDKSLIPPGQFIPYAEENNLIIAITDNLLEQVYQDLSELTGWVSINIVAQHLEQGLLSPWLKDRDNELIKRLSFELTEREQIKKFKEAESEIQLISQFCNGVKLDDFGTGYGGFSYLQKLGVQSIKIDKMFIDTIGTDDLKCSVLDAIITFGHKANLEMVAEGVETKVQVDYLAGKGINLIQGFYYAQPMAKAELIDFYRKNKQ